MSIEQQLYDLIDVIQKNTIALQNLLQAPVASTTKAEKPVKAAAKVAAPKVEEVAPPAGPSAADVEARIDSMLKANKRKEAIALLASFNGAKSKTGIIEQGAEVMAAFVEGADAILLGA
jgi:hypothetical protein